MRSISIIILLFSLSACSKWQVPKASNKVMITIENECYCKITFYKNDTAFYCSDYFDCKETNALYLEITPGEYKAEADNGYKTIKKHFSKDFYNSALSIQFP